MAPGALQSSIEQEIPDIYMALRKQHARLKEIYASCRKRRQAASEPPLQPKVGRSDPCPCGSGKKFKKCCLGKPMQPIRIVPTCKVGSIQWSRSPIH